MIAATGFYVVVLDFFYGDPYSLDNAEKPMRVWLQDHGVDKGFEAEKSVIQALNCIGVSSIGAAGFCWGGTWWWFNLQNVDSHVKIFRKVAHGRTGRYNVEDENVVKCAEEAHGNMLEWFTKHVK